MKRGKKWVKSGLKTGLLFIWTFDSSWVFVNAQGAFIQHYTVSLLCTNHGRVLAAGPLHIYKARMGWGRP